MSHDTVKLGRLADQFIVAAGFVDIESEVAQKVFHSATMDERAEIGNIMISGIEDAISGKIEDDNYMAKKTLGLAEKFAAIAVRISVEDEAADAIDIKATDDTTESNLVAEDAPALARLVAVARQKNGL